MNVRMSTRTIDELNDHSAYAQVTPKTQAGPPVPAVIGQCRPKEIALSLPPTTHRRLLNWIDEVAELTTPDRIVWCDGSDEEWTRITDDLVASGALVRLDPAKKPNSFWARTDPGDVARVEERTFICSEDPDDAGP